VVCDTRLIADDRESNTRYCNKTVCFILQSDVPVLVNFNL